VLLDLTLPDLDGVEVCRIVRSDPAGRHIPIIMVTARGEESDIVLGPGIGGDALVTDRNVEVHVRSIRKKLGPCSNLIETIRGVGYRLEDEEV
jgi:DNA-binding response OmpR family regulator